MIDINKYIYIVKTLKNLIFYKSSKPVDPLATVFFLFLRIIYDFIYFALQFSGTVHNSITVIKLGTRAGSILTKNTIFTFSHVTILHCYDNYL